MVDWDIKEFFKILLLVPIHGMIWLRKLRGSATRTIPRRAFLIGIRLNRNLIECHVAWRGIVFVFVGATVIGKKFGGKGGVLESAWYKCLSGFYVIF